MFGTLLGIGAADTDGSNGVSLDDGSSVVEGSIGSTLGDGSSVVEGSIGSTLGDGISEADGSVGVGKTVRSRKYRQNVLSPYIEPIIRRIILCVSSPFSYHPTNS